jgi:MFS family permease
MFLISEQERGFWLSLVVIGGPLGTTGGYVGTGAITANGGEWWYFFNIIALACAVCTIIVILSPSRYWNLDQVLKEKR